MAEFCIYAFLFLLACFVFVKVVFGLFGFIFKNFIIVLTFLVIFSVLSIGYLGTHDIMTGKELDYNAKPKALENLK